MVIKLAKKWTTGAQLGQGGFGRVFEATSGDGDTAVVKLVPKAPGADREMLFVDLGKARNVVPIIDSGEHKGHWVLVMPRADKNLRQHLKENGGSLGQADAFAILSDVLAALADLDGKVVNRDIKPENTLLLNGYWCLADFGIARYAEASTAPDTHKYAMTAAYAAPERWRSERATGATDIYSVGIMAYEMMAGPRPFVGPDFRDQHLHKEAPELTGASAVLRAMIRECLYKAPGARPPAANLLARLARAREQGSSGALSRLQQAHLAEVQSRHKASRAESERRSARERTDELYRASKASLKVIHDALFDAILTAAPSARADVGDKSQERDILELEESYLVFDQASESSFWRILSDSDAPVFDVVAHSKIELGRPWWDNGYTGRGHSLWFCDAYRLGHFGWFEVAFMHPPGYPPKGGPGVYFIPHALDPNDTAAKALMPAYRWIEIAWPLQPVADDLDEFVNRWVNWFADAMEGPLPKPAQMPERPIPRNWRRADHP